MVRSQSQNLIEWHNMDKAYVVVFRGHVANRAIPPVTNTADNPLRRNFGVGNGHQSGIAARPTGKIHIIRLVGSPSEEPAFFDFNPF